ncbi:class I SAM-dependent methyltransferase [Comamonas flocculans]|uniref:Class I SAM-dependent methyltransferase n=1 Tax=Comamonas flocculans TaxID=2597701 RepID=A0A5B8S025_9BURK|nr:class I SAM-dependent methyltransferase [Comamonas flocculans]
MLADEFELLQRLLPEPGRHVIEPGCGAAAMARRLLRQHPQMRYLGLEVDRLQLARNLQDVPARMRFIEAAAQAIPEKAAQFDLALMLKSLHHVPVALMDQALAEVARVLCPGGHLYVSEPVYGGAFNEVVKVYNDEGVVRAAAQAALDRALALPGSPWRQVAEERFATPVHFADFADFERRMMHPSFAEHHIDDALRARTLAAFAPHCGPAGARFERPMHVRLLQRLPA